MSDSTRPSTLDGPVQRLVSLVRSQKWTSSHREGVEIIGTLLEAFEELEAIREYLWPNQTGLANKHRNALIAIKARERLLKRQLGLKANDKEEARK